jgi:Tfp pilus assembly protein FimT
LTVVSLIGIAAAMMVPNYLQMNERSVMKQAASELHAQINVARMNAMNLNTTVNVNLAMSGGYVTATFTNAGGGEVMEPKVLRRDIIGFTGATQVRFNSLGLRLGGGAGNQTITLQSRNGLNYEIQVTPAGRARWCSKSPCPA